MGHRVQLGDNLVYTTMPYHFIPQAVKLADTKLWKRNLLPLETILDVLDYSRSTFFCVLKLWRKAGDIVSWNAGICRHLHILNYDNVQYLLLLIEQNPDYFLDELLYLLETNHFISVHYITIHQALKRAGVSHRKLKKIALERNENLRADFMVKYEPEELGFLDETSKDERELIR